MVGKLVMTISSTFISKGVENCVCKKNGVYFQCLDHIIFMTLSYVSLKPSPRHHFKTMFTFISVSINKPKCLSVSSR